MKSADIRQAFLDYFAKEKHQIVSSSSLIPGNDPTLLFTNAGMVQFKDVFLGLEKRPYARAASSQRCVRAGGKHNDLENVGYTARHHTFFEMLGNFSFGDYFKRDAIRFAWTFLTEVLGLPAEKLWVTVHISDDEAADIWIKEMGVDAKRFSRLDEDNFWQMGDTGPCGPSSEIFYDHGAEVAGGPPGSADADGDRYIEIWNLVFMQFERQSDGTLVPLPKPSVDTGMGLERVAAVMQGVHSNYDIDLFQALLAAVQRETGARDASDKSLRVIADHIRSCSFLIVDGVVPSNEGRGYVLRRIMRRAIRHGHKLGQKQPFFHKLVPALVAQMGSAYPELAKAEAQVVKVILAEEEQFARTLENGMAVLEEQLRDLKGTQLSGDLVFTLYDTYGFPVDLTNDIARERGLSLDMAAYEARMKAQREQSKAAGTFKVDYTKNLHVDGTTTFLGYEQLAEDATVTALFRGDTKVDKLAEGEEGVVVLDRTPFYGESGGQVGDAGLIESESLRFEVIDCQKSASQHLHIGRVVKGSLSLGQRVNASVDASIRARTARNHSATHLLHAALRRVLGEHVGQKGSLVDAEKLRFDFSHFEPVSKEQLTQIEAMVNAQILANSAVDVELSDMEGAKKKGAMALFGEKYGDVVRVLTMGTDAFSVELCGGTHVRRTGDIGLLHIVSETGIAAGVRRIEAVSGEGALQALAALQNTVDRAAQSLRTPAANVVDKLEQLLAQNRQLEKDLAQLRAKLATASADDWLQEAQDLGGIKVLLKTVEGMDPKGQRDLVDKLKSKLGRSAVMLATINEGKISLVAGVSKDATDLIQAGAMVKSVAEKIGGKGGGRPDMAQGGGSDVEALDPAMQSLKTELAERLR